MLLQSNLVNVIDSQDILPILIYFEQMQIVSLECISASI
jgi:hypothetical protein